MEMIGFVYVPVTSCLGKEPLVSILEEAGWAPELVWIQQIEILGPAGNRTPSHATHTHCDRTIPAQDCFMKLFIYFVI
jgi:hypothetical protein